MPYELHFFLRNVTLFCAAPFSVLQSEGHLHSSNNLNPLETNSLSAMKSLKVYNEGQDVFHSGVQFFPAVRYILLKTTIQNFTFCFCLSLVINLRKMEIFRHS